MLRATDCGWRGRRPLVLLAGLALLLAASPGPRARAAPLQDRAGGEAPVPRLGQVSGLDPAPASDALSIEWSTRRWAHNPVGNRSELDRALAAPNWTLRAAACDALARAAASGVTLPDTARGLAARGLADPHPNVRAGAAALFAAAPALELPESEFLAELAAHPLPVLRLELARALGVRADRLEPDAVALLARLARDGDERVAGAARAGLWALTDPAPAAELLAERFAEGTATERVALAELIARTRGLAPPGFGSADHADHADMRATWTTALRTALRAAPPEYRALLEAALFLAGAEGDAGLLAAGWADPHTTDQRDALLARSARFAGPELAAELLARLVDGPAPDSGALGRAWIEAAVDAAGPALISEPLTRRLGAEHAAFFLETLASRAGGLDPDALAFWLEPERSRAERLAAVRLLAALLDASAERGPPAGRQLVRLLGDGDTGLVRGAWFALAVADDARPWLADLRRSWLARGAPLADLAHLSRRAAPTPFRADLLELGERGGDERGAVLDLLELFEGDAGVAELIARWLAEELDEIDPAPRPAAGSQPVEKTDPVEKPDSVDLAARRASELRAMGALRALADLGRAEDVDVVEHALAWSRGRSTQVGKVAAAALARLPGGLGALPAYLGEEQDRRTRIEVAIALTRDGPRTAARADVREAATEALERDLEFAAWDLRVRMIDALARAGTRSSRAVLERALFDPKTEPTERPAVINALVDAGGGAELAPMLATVLARVVRGSRELGPRRAAVRGLERIGAVSLLAELELEFAEEARTPGVQGEASALLADEARQARAALGGLTAEERRGLLASALASADRDLSALFRGESTARTEFRWRTELAVAAALAQRGQLAEALEDGPWWRIDGALLSALGECALASEPETARRLLRAAHVALLGEPEPDGRGRMRLLARELELARGGTNRGPAAALEWLRREGQ